MSSENLIILLAGIGLFGWTILGKIAASSSEKIVGSIGVLDTSQSSSNTDVAYSTGETINPPLDQKWVV